MQELIYTAQEHANDLRREAQRVRYTKANRKRTNERGRPTRKNRLLRLHTQDLER